MMEGYTTAFDRTGDLVRLSRIAGQKVARHAFDRMMLQHFAAVSAIDETHAAVCFVHVDEWNPAGGTLVAQVASPIALILMPISWRTLSRRLAQELVVPEFELQAGQRRAKLDKPFAVRCLIGLRPDQRWR